MMLVELRQGMPLKIFPAPSGNVQHMTPVTWYAPTDELPDEMDAERKKYIQDAFSLLYKYALNGQWGQMDQMLTKMQQYQLRYGAASLPSKTQTWAEHIYNKVPFATILFMVCLTMAFLTLIRKKWMQRIGLTVLGLSFLALTFGMALRWIISGTIPMSNGYETMLTMAWFVMLISLLMYRRFPVILTFGLLLSGFFLLVSHISQMDPQIGHLMPVLSSPLLTIHVSVIMMAYALLSITFLTGIWGLITAMKNYRKPKDSSLFTLHSSLQMSQLFLYPALTCMGLGIFIGAIWANVSWGTYWSWDPKETWALITFMVYAVPVHQQSISWLRNPRHYHLYMVLAFLTILMTYFGVNYFLGGMHSYA
jgi:cytochrome c-type biogenesis protein CcsB